jgi:ribonucleoside-diphosphate reductase alpha chain
MTLKTFDIAEEIWQKKYKFSGNTKVPSDESYDDTWRRIAKGLSENEQSNQTSWENKFYDILKDFKFLPAGRIISNAGSGLTSVTMFNCYVMNKIDDSMNGIFDTVKNAALTQKQGGGVGFDFSTIRPLGDLIEGCNTPASGPISFMEVFDATCKTIMSAGQRRGAQMGVLRCDHPDIEEFIQVKRENGKLRMFNLSVAVTNPFVEAVKNNLNWELKFNGKVYKTVKAINLWDLIMKSTYDFAEPGVLFVDNVNEMNNLYYCETIAATNPCGEVPLPEGGACLLGSVNLTKFVKNPFTDKAKIDYVGIENTIKIAVRMLDNVIDISRFPLELQKMEAGKKRRMGIGLTGLADLFIFMGIKYGSSESLALCEKIMKSITYAAYRSSIEVAKEKGAFSKFEVNKYLKSRFVEQLPDDIKNDIKQFGIRNSHLTSIAPTGTISLLAGNVSSGLEPVFAFHYSRKIRNTTENDVTEVDVQDYAYKEYLKYLGKDMLSDKELPPYFVSSSDIKPVQHLQVQGVLQKYIDSSISKTINIPVDYPFTKFKNIYLKAAELGCKGCTTFRPSEHITGILVKKEDKKKKETVEIKQTKRPKELIGTTYKIKTPLSTDALYVTINDIIEENGHIRPFELFINTKNLQHFSWIVAMTRLISAVFRNNSNPSFLVEELKSVYDPNGGYFNKGAYVPSLVADIGRTIESHLEKIGIIESKKNLKTKIVDAAICPMCNEKALIYKEGCMNCLHCNYSRCS